jgi:hypothetical protein
MQVAAQRKSGLQVFDYVFICAIGVIVIAGILWRGQMAAQLIGKNLPSVSVTEPNVTVFNKPVMVVNDAPDIKK